MSYNNKQTELKEKINEAFPGNSWSFTGEFDGRKWQFLLEHDSVSKPTEEQENKLNQLAESVEQNATFYILPISNSSY